MLHLPDTEKSYWRESAAKGAYPSLHENLVVDVVIIGAGISGLTTAYLLKKAGSTVAVLEKSTVGGGTTGRTTGKVTAQHNLIYEKLVKRHGKETARLYGEANMVAIEQMEHIIRTEKIACDWQRDDNYVFTTDPDKIKQFKQEAETAADLGLPATFETTSPLPFPISGAVKFSNQAKINSQKYLEGLARAVNGGGSYVFEHSDVTGIRGGANGRVKTKNGIVRAKHIVVATSVPTMPLLARGGYCILEYPTESYIVTGSLPEPLKGMYISPDKEHHSILPMEIDGQNIVLIGGGGNLAGMRVSKKAKYERLAGYGQKWFNVSSITNSWSDRDYIAYDRIPLIGKLYPWSKSTYVATAYGKWGLTNGTVAGIILCDVVQGKPNPWAHTFNSQRIKPVLSIPRAVAEYLTSKKR